MGASKISQLKNGAAVHPEFDEELRSDAVRVCGRVRVNIEEWREVSHLEDKRCTVEDEHIKRGRARGRRAGFVPVLPLSNNTMILDLSPSQAVECEAYAGNVKAWVAKDKDHPGQPPAGYESYRRLHPEATAPQDHPAVEFRYFAHMNEKRSTGAVANIPADTLTEIVNAPNKLIWSLADALGIRNGGLGINIYAGPHYRARAVLPVAGPSKYGIRAHGRAVRPKTASKANRAGLGSKSQAKEGNRRKPGLAARVGGKSKAKSGNRARGLKKPGKYAKVVVAAINVRAETASDDPVGKREETPLPEPGEVEEDVHMDDWMVFPKDEEDDGAAGALGWDGKEAEPIM
ncbi:hypothetical protein C8R44DRAFT_906702 [Mycena epipterygia]|nr:hypothetical protein C8R44DRAFT_906702 [Mycena epipterygia]